MKKYFFYILFSFSTVFGYSQVGITAGAQFLQAPAWEAHLQDFYNTGDLSIFNPTVYGGLDYWFRLKNKRIEFTPEVGFALYKTQTLSARLPEGQQMDNFSSNYFTFFFNTNIYPLDFGGDCNCPTFNKDGDLIKKGFFIRIAPGVNYNVRSQEVKGLPGDDPTKTIQTKETGFSLRAGVGLDIGVSSFFTITPMIFGVYNTPNTWTLFEADNLLPDPNIAVEEQVIQIFAGIRLGFRFDELNKYGYR